MVDWSRLPICGALLAAITVPAFAADMKPTPSKEPKAGKNKTHLVDKTVPAYGITSRYASPSRDIDVLYHVIRDYTAEIEGMVMAGDLHRASMAESKAKNKGERQLSDEEARLIELLEELSQADVILHPSTTPDGVVLPQQWQIDESFANLQRAGDLLRVTLSDEAFASIDVMHQAWLANYKATAGKARDAKINEVMKERKLSRKEAEKLLEREHWHPPYPEMRADANYSVSTTPAAAAPEPQAEAPVAPVAPEPEPATPVEQPAPEVPVPAEAPAEPAPETPAPMDEAMSNEAPAETPAPEAAPAETPIEESAAAVPEEMPAEIPADAPVEAPADIPAETSAPEVVPAEPAAEAPAETPAEAPAEMPVETPAEAPAEPAPETSAPTDSGASSEAPAPEAEPTEPAAEAPATPADDASAETPAAPADAPAEAPAPEAAPETSAPEPEESPAPETGTEM